MEPFKNILQPHINADIEIGFGCIGTAYSQILIVENGKIRSIGEFIYRLWRELSNKEETVQLLITLSLEAEKYRKGLRDKKPSLAFGNEGLRVV